MKRSLFALAALVAGFAASAMASVKDTAVTIADKAHAAVFGFMASQGLVLGVNYLSDVYTGKFPLRLIPVSSDLQEHAVPFTLPAVALAVNDLVLLCKLPAGTELVDFDLIVEDADTNAAPTLAMSIGSANAGLTDLGTIYKAGMTGPGTGTIERCTGVVQFGESTMTERAIALKVTAAAATYAPGKRGVLVLRTRG